MTRRQLAKADLLPFNKTAGVHSDLNFRFPYLEVLHNTSYRCERQVVEILHCQGKANSKRLLT